MQIQIKIYTVNTSLNSFFFCFSRCFLLLFNKFLLSFCNSLSSTFLLPLRLNFFHTSLKLSFRCLKRKRPIKFCCHGAELSITFIRPNNSYRLANALLTYLNDMNTRWHTLWLEGSPYQLHIFRKNNFSVHIHASKLLLRSLISANKIQMF